MLPRDDRLSSQPNPYSIGNWYSRKHRWQGYDDPVCFCGTVSYNPHCCICDPMHAELRSGVETCPESEDCITSWIVSIPASVGTPAFACPFVIFENVVEAGIATVTNVTQKETKKWSALEYPVGGVTHDNTGNRTLSQRSSCRRLALESSSCLPRRCSMYASPQPGPEMLKVRYITKSRI